MFPLSNFEQLVGLCQNEQFCVETFSKYKLIAIILQKETGSVLGRNLSNAFDWLDMISGKNFAIFSFVTPPRQWARSHPAWTAMKKNLFNCDDCDNQDFINDLQRRLNIPYLPTIILTGSLLSNEYVVAKAYNKQIVNQLEDIASFVESVGENFSINSPGFLERIRRGIDIPVFLSTENGESLARNIVDLMALRSFKGTRSLYSNDLARQRFTAMSWIKSTLEKLKQSFETLANDKDASIEEVDSARERYSDYRCAALNAKNEYDICVRGKYVSSEGNELNERIESENCIFDIKVKGITLRNKTFNYDDCFEYERPKNDIERFRLSFDILKDFEKESHRQAVKYNNFIRNKFRTRDDDEYAGEFKDFDWMDEEYVFQEDFADEGACLGKIIEEEINASIVQLIRKEKFGMEMPEYYRVYNSNLDKCEITNKGRKVAFNFYDYARCALRSVPVGDVNASINALIRECPYITDTLGIFAEHEYLERISKFATFRGYAAHPGYVTRDEFENMYAHFSDIVSSYLRNIVALKASLKKKPDLFNIL